MRGGAVLAHRGFIKGVLINEHGQRFCNEDLYQSLLGEICLWRERGRVWLALDDGVFEKPQLPTQIMAVGESWEEVEREAKLFPPARWRGRSPSTTSTPRAGRIPCPQGARWLEPLVRPPFVLLYLTLENYPFWSAFTLGGLHTRPTGEVLDGDGAVVRASTPPPQRLGPAGPGYNSGCRWRTRPSADGWRDGSGQGSPLAPRAARRAAHGGNRATCCEGCLWPMQASN